jgi:hypothetical protein
MNKDLQIVFAVLFGILLLFSIGTFLYGIYAAVAYSIAKKAGVDNMVLTYGKNIMVATLVVGILGIVGFSFGLFFVLRK